MAELSDYFIERLRLPNCGCSMCNSEVTEAKIAAEKRAGDLLVSFLDKEQRRDLVETGYFTVVGSDQRSYRIDCAGYSGNVVELDHGRARKSWCCYPNYRLSVPLADRLLGQLLVLKTNAEYFRRVGY